LTNIINEEKQFSDNNSSDSSTSVTLSLEVDISQGYKVSPGDCKLLVCLPKVVSIAVPYQCMGNEAKTNDIEHAEVMYVKSSSGN